MLAEGSPSFGERGASGGARQKLDAKLALKPDKPSTDDRLRQAKTPGGDRDATAVSDLHEGLHVFEADHSGVPFFALQSGLP